MDSSIMTSLVKQLEKEMMFLLSYSHGNGDTGTMAVSADRVTLIKMAMGTLIDELHQQDECFDQSLCVISDDSDGWSVMYNGDFDGAMSYSVKEIDLV